MECLLCFISAAFACTISCEIKTLTAEHARWLLLLLCGVCECVWWCGSAIDDFNFTRSYIAMLNFQRVLFFILYTIIRYSLIWSFRFLCVFERDCPESLAFRMGDVPIMSRTQRLMDRKALVIELLFLLFASVAAHQPTNVLKSIPTTTQFHESLVVDYLSDTHSAVHFTFSFFDQLGRPDVDHRSSAYGDEARHIESYDLFPKPLAQILPETSPIDFSLSLTQGKWRSEQWGLWPASVGSTSVRNATAQSWWSSVQRPLTSLIPPDLARSGFLDDRLRPEKEDMHPEMHGLPLPSSPPHGALVRATLHEDNVDNDDSSEDGSRASGDKSARAAGDDAWMRLLQSAGAHLCASLSLADESKTSFEWVAARSAAGAAGGAGVGESKGEGPRPRLARRALLSREPVCTENLTPWLALLPGAGAVGLASLLHSTTVFDHSYLSLRLAAYKRTFLLEGMEVNGRGSGASPHSRHSDRRVGYDLTLSLTVVVPASTLRTSARPSPSSSSSSATAIQSVESYSVLGAWSRAHSPPSPSLLAGALRPSPFASSSHVYLRLGPGVCANSPATCAAILASVTASNGADGAGGRGIKQGARQDAREDTGAAQAHSVCRVLQQDTSLSLPSSAAKAAGSMRCQDVVFSPSSSSSSTSSWVLEPLVPPPMVSVDVAGPSQTPSLWLQYPLSSAAPSPLSSDSYNVGGWNRRVSSSSPQPASPLLASIEHALSGSMNDDPFPQSDSCSPIAIRKYISGVGLHDGGVHVQVDNLLSPSFNASSSSSANALCVRIVDSLPSFVDTVYLSSMTLTISEPASTPDTPHTIRSEELVFSQDLTTVMMTTAAPTLTATTSIASSSSTSWRGTTSRNLACAPRSARVRHRSEKGSPSTWEVDVVVPAGATAVCVTLSTRTW